MFDSDDASSALALLDGAEIDDAARIDQIAALERLKAAAAAAQARITAAFDASQRAVAAARGVPAARQAQGVAEQVALARQESPHQGARHLGMARALVREMPHTLAALARGETTERRALSMVVETAALSLEHRQSVDANVGRRLHGMGDRAVAAAARREGYRLDPLSTVRRTARAENDRCVTVRPAPDCMTYVTGLLPVAQGVAVYAALRKRAESLRAQGDDRSLGQLMADTLVRRVTGLERVDAAPVELHLVMTDRSLLGIDHEPAEVHGQQGAVGAVPAWLARRTVRQAERAWVRRLFTRPGDGQLAAADSRRRTFPKPLRDLIVARDRACRTPWCDAPVSHLDHVRPHATGGETSVDNGQGLCARCNLTKQLPGWLARPSPDSTRVLVRTPTGHVHTANAPPAPGAGSSQVEMYLSDLVLEVAA